jgi:hypothetical protein
MMAKRQKITSARLAEILIVETGKSLGGDARFLAPHLKVRARGGEPNWDASIDIFGSAVITETFCEARERAKTHYDLDDASHERPRSSAPE